MVKQLFCSMKFVITLLFYLGYSQANDSCCEENRYAAKLSPKQIYLTIDDAPSHHTKEKIRYLKENNIPAIFYCRGDAIEKYKDNVIELIREGFLIGNHSYSHPHFSSISSQQCFEQILKTEKLIDECYAIAGIIRPCKIIRLPFGDRGAGDNGRLPATHEEREKVMALQLFLKNHGFTKIDFEGFDDQSLDSLWSLDSQDYKKNFIANESLYLQNFKATYFASERPSEVLLVHDFDYNHHLFMQTMDFLKKQECIFLSSTQ